MKRLLYLLWLLPLNSMAKPAADPVYDIVVYGGTSSGIMAAYTAKMMGRSVVLIEPGKHLGGLSTGGLGFTDIGNKYAVTGLALDFYRRIGQHYGRFESWIFEPHVASAVFAQYINKAKFPILLQHSLLTVQKEQKTIQSITVINTAQSGRNHITIRAKIFIDCSYEGDLMAKAGISYTTGREANNVYKETWNGVQVHKGNQLPDGIDPYKVPGDPSSGLLWGISNASLPALGSGDKKIQAYNFRICLTNDPVNRIPIIKPDAYDSTKYELLLRIIAKNPNINIRNILKFDRMPNNKTDINNNGGFSTDMIGMNWDYAEADEAARKKIRKEHELYIKGLLYFIGHDPRIPASMRNFMLEWGYPRDEYVDNDHWSPQLYVREARRMVGRYVMTEANCKGKVIVTDGVGMGAYGMDSHNVDRLVINGQVKNEGDVQIGVPGPYPVAYRALLPKEEECSNLLVPVCLSASHIAYGSIRMEPVFMVLGQSAATAAVLALKEKKTVQEVDITKVQQVLKEDPLADGSQPEIIIDDQHKQQVTMNGSWRFQKGDGYGPGYYFTEVDSSQDHAIQFTASIPKSGWYEVYTYMLARLKNTTSQTLALVFNGEKKEEILIKKAAIGLQGQTSGEWYSLGKYQFIKGKDAYVKISTIAADGIVTADAVLLRPVEK